ncbi:alpha,alpha-trehalase TreH1 [Sulfolobus acidocaldarius]|nr:alpha,alpha-trehalase TreH1 [Sulfolobus acidocaldarius]
MKPLGFIGNGLTSALVDNGSIVWLTFPRFDSPSVFGKLLDDNAGEFSIRPVEDKFKVSQSYLVPNVLSTTFKSSNGKAEIVDLMPIGEKAIIRKVRTEIPLSFKIIPMFNYGLYRPIIRRKDDGIQFLNPVSRECLSLLSDVPTDEIKPPGTTLYLVYSSDCAYGPLDKGKQLENDLENSFNLTIDYWKDKIRSNDEVWRTSVGVLLGLIYSPSGSSIAAATTSLPEAVGDSRNWDYRFVWVRDSSMISEALLYSGYVVEARRILNFMLALVNFTAKPLLHPLYAVDGSDPPPEIEIPWLSGYMNSRPVRVGNAAASQIQLDIEGFLVDAIYKYYKYTSDRVFVEENWDKIKYIGDWVSKNWMLKDAGMWEDRGDPKHYTHSKVMMWVALDRIEKIMNVKIHEKDEIKEWVMRNCVKDGSFVRSSDSNDVDANLLTLPLYDFIDVKDPIFLKTLKRIEDELYVDGFVKRYSQDFMGEAKHPFALATIWLARVYIRLGRKERAMELLDKVLKPSGTLYLIGEHIDVENMEYTGNYPQAFVHAQLLLALKEVKGLST